MSPSHGCALQAELAGQEPAGKSAGQKGPPIPSFCRSAIGLPDLVQLAFRIGFAAMLLMAIGWAAGGVHQVPADSQAVVQRFGQIERITSAGLVFSWPSPIETITLVPAYERQIPVKVVQTSNGPSQETDFQIHQPDDVILLRRQKDAWNGQYFLTGDSSVIRYETILYYRVTDPAAYVLSRGHVEPALQRLYLASTVTIAAGHDLDDFLVARPGEGPGLADAGIAGRRQAIPAELVAAINQRLAALRWNQADLGIEVSHIDIIALLPPIAKAAFDDVLTATQTADQTEAAARTDAARIIQEAQRAHDRSRSDAEAAAEEQVRTAIAQTADVALLHKEITPVNRDSLLRQYYRDRIGSILRKIGQVTTLDVGGDQPTIIPGPGK